MKKITFEKQILIGVGCLFLMHICSWIFKNGIFINTGWVVYGLLFTINPVCPEKSKKVKNMRLWIRLAGVLCIILGIMTRFGV